MLICILNIIGLFGFAILNCTLAGQTMASVNVNLSWKYVILFRSCIERLIYPLRQRRDRHCCTDISSGIVLRIYGP